MEVLKNEEIQEFYQLRRLTGKDDNLDRVLLRTAGLTISEILVL
jgi:hypothetical protein